MASGDDVVLFCEPSIKDVLVQTIMSLTSRTKDDQTGIGLGQCLKTCNIGKFYDIDFCSKIFYTPDGSLSQLTYSRDLYKILT